MAKTNDFIQANMAAVKMTKSFMILPQINIKLIGGFHLFLVFRI